MRFGKNKTDGGWLAGDTRATRRVRMGSERARNSVRQSPGGAAPGRPGEAGIPAMRRGAETGSCRTAGNGAAHHQVSSPAPVWLAALNAARCLAARNGELHDVSWNCSSGRALYTNAGADAETIHPLGVKLEGGQTLAVWWMPGETGYTLEVYGRNELCA